MEKKIKLLCRNIHVSETVRPKASLTTSLNPDFKGSCDSGLRMVVVII